jgi:hypothetical protein
MKILDQIKITLRDDGNNKNILYLDVYESHLSKKWLQALNYLIKHDYHLEKNYCFMGFVDSKRNGEFILNQINASIQVINASNLGYHINDHFSMQDCITDEPDGDRTAGRNIVHSRFNRLHRYFEDLQGVSGNISQYFHRADHETRWHIRQLNLLCHEFESWALSYRKQIEAPEWTCPSQLMCWLNAPRFALEAADFDLFGIETLSRKQGGVYVGVNKAIGKHHWEVFQDEGRDSRLKELTTSTLRSQTEAAGDFDIEWGRDAGHLPRRRRLLKEFRDWLSINGFDPDDKTLTIGHPQVGQIDIERSFGSKDYQDIWNILNTFQDIYSIRTSDAVTTYDYRWSDADYRQRQINILKGN